MNSAFLRRTRATKSASAARLRPPPTPPPPLIAPLPSTTPAAAPNRSPNRAAAANPSPRRRLNSVASALRCRPLPSNRAASTPSPRSAVAVQSSRRLRPSSSLAHPSRDAAMPPKKTKVASGFKGVRARPNGRWSAELQHEGMRYYLGTFDIADLATRAYDVAGWRLGIPREQLNDSSITCLQDAIFIGPPMQTKVKTRLVKKKEEPARVLETDDEAMARFAREHPKYMQHGREFF